jgi:hypothetical protein
MIAIQESLFKDHFKDLPNRWADFIEKLDALLILLLGYVGLEKRKKKSEPEAYTPTKTTLPTTLLTFMKLQRKSNPAPEDPTQTEQKPEATPEQKDSSELVNLFVSLVNLSGYLFVASIFLVIRATIAASIALINTVIWVCVVFSNAGPMILSGLYEAAVDRKVIKNTLAELREEARKKKLVQRKIFYKRVHQLYAVLVGNLALPENPREARIDPESRTVWEDVKILVRPEDVRNTTFAKEEQDAKLLVAHKLHEKHIEVTDTRLKGMLGCQASFGGAVGAPVVFYIGSFLYNIISNFSNLGDNDTSHALAFGMWWMTIPHVAIVSGCLLAGNNPNTLEVIVCSITGPWSESAKEKGWLQRWYQHYYQSVYTPVWMSDRGRNKKEWIDEIYHEYDGPSRVPKPTSEESHKEVSREEADQSEEHQEGDRRKVNKGEFRLNPLDWLILVLITLVLMIFPFVLAFLTSFYTPEVGLSCRSLTFLLYFVFQICLSAIWLWDFTSKPRQARGQHVEWLPFAFKKPKMLTNTTEPTKSDGPEEKPALPEKRKNAPTIYLVLLTFTILGSIFTSFVGTFLQIVGVYRNCLCNLPIGSWHKKGDHPIVLSTNSIESINLAKKWWEPTGVASIVLLIVTCYIGWWYQRHWRMQFREVVGLLLNPPKMTVAASTGATDEGAGDGEAPAGGMLKDKPPEEQQTKEPEKKEGDDAAPSGSAPIKQAPKEPEVEVTELEPPVKEAEKAEGDEITPVST